MLPLDLTCSFFGLPLDITSHPDRKWSGPGPAGATLECDPYYSGPLREEACIYKSPANWFTKNPTDQRPLILTLGLLLQKPLEAHHSISQKLGYSSSKQNSQDAGRIFW